MASGSRCSKWVTAQRGGKLKNEKAEKNNAKPKAKD